MSPAQRTTGQLIADTIRFYQERFWRVLPLGLVLAAVNQITHDREPRTQILILLAAAPFMTAAYVAASSLVTEQPASAEAFIVGVLIWLPVPALIFAYSLPSILWLAFVGLAVPAAVAERLSIRDAFARGRRLGTVDYVHALGSLAALVLLFGLTRIVLGFALRDVGEQGIRAAVFLADLVISPILFVGGALLYQDQAARLRSASQRRRNDADLHPAVESHRPGHSDAEVESGPAPRGES